MRWFDVVKGGASRLLKKKLVTPAKAGVQDSKSMVSSIFWIPASAGMTKFDVSVQFLSSLVYPLLRMGRVREQHTKP